VVFVAGSLAAEAGLKQSVTGIRQREVLVFGPGVELFGDRGLQPQFDADSFGSMRLESSHQALLGSSPVKHRVVTSAS
jgi:hypothetical protein